MQTAQQIASEFVSDSRRADLELAMLRHFEDRLTEQRTALAEAERFMEYFTSEGPRSFEGPGTPQSCLAMIRVALGKSPQ